MHIHEPGPLAPRIGTLGLAACMVGALAVLAGTARVAPPEAPGVSALLLAVGAALAGAAAIPRGSARPARLSLAFVLAAYASLPPPAGLLTMLAAIAACAGGGPAGPSRTGWIGATSNVIAAAAVHVLFVLTAGAFDPDSPAGLVPIAAAFILAELVAYGAAGISAAAVRLAPPEIRPRAILRQVTLESATIPLAWLLVVQAGTGPVAWAAMAAAILFGGLGLARLERARRALSETNQALAARFGELATLHAVSREILSSLEPARVIAVVERECRKIFDANVFCIALIDRDSGAAGLVHRREAGGPVTEQRPAIESAAAAWVLDRHRALRVPDLASDEAPAELRAARDEPTGGSLLAVPLMVEGRVTGVLTLRSPWPEAYDDHAESVLSTLAQQAAVALENARNYAMATVDSLTGLHLRDYFFRRLEEEYQRARRYGGSFCILMLDLDGFKAVNDRHGHLIGDRYLRAVGATIRGRLRAADLACRYGGDEICLLLPETGLDGARPIAERLRRAIGRLVVEAEGLPVRSTASIGIAAFPDHDTGDLKGLVLRADQALYRAKRDGRDRVVPFAA